MDCSEDDNTSDFFKAFLHSLRSTCFQFVDFRDHVSIRGFLAVDVDGQNPQHYVLSEIVSRGKDAGMASFPLEVVTSSKSFDSEPTGAAPSVRLKKKYSSPDLKDHKIRRIWSNNAPENKPIQTTKALDTGVNPGHGPSPIDGKPPHPYTFRSVRSDPSNSTFVMDHNASTINQNTEVSKKEGNKEHNVSKLSFSTVTANIPNGFSLHSKQRLTPNPKQKRKYNNNSASFSKRARNLTHSICKNKEGVCQNSSSSRKRPHKSSSGSSDSTYCISTSLESESSCEDNTVYPGRSRQKGEKEKSETRIGDRNRTEQNRVGSSRSTSQGQESPKSDFFSKQYPFENFLAVCNSDQDCSITSVKPNYLVSHSEGVSTIMSSRCPEPNVNMFSKSSDSSGKRKLLSTKEIVANYIDI